MNNKIVSVEPLSIADEIGLAPGDEIIAVNGNKIEDELDLRFLCSAEYLEIEVIIGGEHEIIEIDNPEREDLGVTFESALFGNAKHCSNKCIFCFIDQLPPNMRESLYFKDDDSRLSFLTGNYVTLTNAKDADLDKIIKMHMEPINVSVHTTDPKLRVFMLKNPKAARINEQMKKLADGGIHMNCQIVLVRDINDGENLIKTVRDLSNLYPYVTSVSAVPMGMTKFRDGLFKAKSYDKKSSQKVISDIFALQQDMLAKISTRFIYIADEFFLMAEHPMPGDDEYEGYYQIENGVGLIRSFETDFCEAMKTPPPKHVSVDLITGLAAYDEIKKLAQKACLMYNNVNIRVHGVRNDFFGEKITVAGLVTGGDIIKQLSGKIESGIAVIPNVMLRSGTDIFLDDLTVSDVERGLNAKIIVTDGTGDDLWNTIINSEEKE